MNLQLKEYEDKLNEMINQNEKHNEMEKEKNKMEKKLKHQLKRLQTQKNIRPKSFQSEVVREENRSPTKSIEVL